MVPPEDPGEDFEVRTVDAVVDLKHFEERVASPVEVVSFVRTVGRSFER